MLPIPIMLYFLHYTDTVTLVDNHFPTYLMSARNTFPYMVIRRWGLEAESCKATLVDSLTKNMELEMSTMSLLMFYINGIPLNL